MTGGSPPRVLSAHFPECGRLPDILPGAFRLPTPRAILPAGNIPDAISPGINFADPVVGVHRACCSGSCATCRTASTSHRNELPEYLLRACATGRAAGAGLEGRERDLRAQDPRTRLGRNSARRIHLHRVRLPPAGMPCFWNTGKPLNFKTLPRIREMSVEAGAPARHHPEPADQEKWETYGLDDTSPIAVENGAPDRRLTAIPCTTRWTVTQGVRRRLAQPHRACRQIVNTLLGISSPEDVDSRHRAATGAFPARRTRAPGGQPGGQRLD